MKMAENYAGVCLTLHASSTVDASKSYDDDDNNLLLLLIIIIIT